MTLLVLEEKKVVTGEGVWPFGEYGLAELEIGQLICKDISIGLSWEKVVVMGWHQCRRISTSIES